MTVKQSAPETCQPCAHVRKARNRKLLRRRDLKLLQRFYQLTELQRRRFDDVVHILSTEEFFISEQRVWCIVKRNLHILDKIKAGEEVDAESDFEDKNQLALFND